MFIVPAEEASRRLRADHGLLLAEVNELTAEQLAATYEVSSGPLGDSWHAAIHLHRLPLASGSATQEGAPRS